MVRMKIVVDEEWRMKMMVEDLTTLRKFRNTEAKI